MLVHIHATKLKVTQHCDDPLPSSVTLLVLGFLSFLACCCREEGEGKTDNEIHTAALNSNKSSIEFVKRHHSHELPWCSYRGLSSQLQECTQSQYIPNSAQKLIRLRFLEANTQHFFCVCIYTCDDLCRIFPQFGKGHQTTNTVLHRTRTYVFLQARLV